MGGKGIDGLLTIIRYISSMNGIDTLIPNNIRSANVVALLTTDQSNNIFDEKTNNINNNIHRNEV